MKDSTIKSEDLVSFSGLILAFSSAALTYLGHEITPGHKAQVNLDLAKQNIDFIKLLEQKTHGNLTTEEGELLSQVLLDLSDRYSKVSKQK